MSKKTVVLDSNFLIYLFKHKLLDSLQDLSFQYNLVIIDRVIEEIERVAPSAYNILKSIFSSLHLNIVKIKTDESKHRYTDDMLLEFAKKHDAILATNDKELKLKAKAEGIQLMFIRKKSVIQV